MVRIPAKIDKISTLRVIRESYIDMTEAYNKDTTRSKFEENSVERS